MLPQNKRRKQGGSLWAWASALVPSMVDRLSGVRLIALHLLGHMSSLALPLLRKATRHEEWRVISPFIPANVLGEGLAVASAKQYSSFVRN